MYGAISIVHSVQVTHFLLRLIMYFFFSHFFKFSPFCELDSWLLLIAEVISKVKLYVEGSM